MCTSLKGRAEYIAKLGVEVARGDMDIVIDAWDMPPEAVGMGLGWMAEGVAYVAVV